MAIIKFNKGFTPPENTKVIAFSEKYHNYPFSAVFFNGKWYDSDFIDNPDDGFLNEKEIKNIQWLYFDAETYYKDNVLVLKNHLDEIVIDDNNITIEHLYQSQIRWLFIGFVISLILFVPIIIALFIALFIKLSDYV